MSQVHQVRELLGLTPAELGQLVGAQAGTVARWEKGIYHPPPFVRGLLQEFKRAKETVPELDVRTSLYLGGAMQCLYELLDAARKKGA